VIPRTFVAGLHLRWTACGSDRIICSRGWPCGVPVVVVEEPFAAGEDRDELRRDGNVTIVRPLRRRGWSPPWLDEHTIATARRHAVEAPVGVWLSTPIMLSLADAFDAQPLVYDVMDELANFDIVPAGLVDAERETLARRAGRVHRRTVAVCGARRLGEKVRCEPSGVEFERFAADVAPHPLPSQLGGPVFGYVGVIDERLDVGLIETLADAFPDGHIVLVGPVFKLDPARLPRRANVHLTGPVPYDALPSWLAGFDVALMPFAQNRATGGDLADEDAGILRGP